MLKTRNSGELRAMDAGQSVTLAGWVHRRRDHGGLIFIDLRDTTGYAQVVFDPRTSPDAYVVADGCRNEYVLQIEGEVALRPEGSTNATLATGEIEVKAGAASVLAESETPPFGINDDSAVEELLRLRYRYLDLRRQRMHDNLRLRSRVAQHIREFLGRRDFVEIETPMLAASTPEGARDYLVPSRVHPGSFYALPQSPQQYKQLLMVAGFERYFQIAHCLRDEDLRADRQPEHTQLDLEMSFVEESDILDLQEELYVSLFTTLRPALKVPRPFPRLRHEDVVNRYGTDKPDLRFGLELADLSDLVASSEFGVFRSTVEAGGIVKGIAAPGGAEFSRRQIDELTDFVKQYGARGLVSIALLGDPRTLSDDQLRSPVARYLDVGAVKEMAVRLGAEAGDLLLIVADSPKMANQALDALRRELARRLDLADPDTRLFLQVVDFPLLAWNEDEDRWEPEHHPFTAPREEDLDLLDSAPGDARARHYDLVCNGWELGSGSIRIHRPDVQARIFKLLEISDEEARTRFGHMLEAFTYGAPPHGGFGHGLDRVVAILAGEPDIREVIAFPKTKSASDPMTGAPSSVSSKQLEELHIAVVGVENGGGAGQSTDKRPEPASVRSS
ncbi:MAG: aspartate--tRNA ligase [Dehalococcoidia bacterium]|nr:aspartate--tRNA ligase [Dehalococcoidia bacterium]